MSTSLDISFSGKPFAPINVPGLKFDMIPNTLLTKSPNKWLSPNEIKSLERLIKFGYISRNVHPNLLPVSSNSYGSAFTIKLNKIPAALFTACQESFEFSNSPLCEVIKIEDSKQKADNVLPGPMDKFKISIPTDLEREEFKKTKKPRFRKTSVSLLKKVLLSNLLKSHTANPKRLGISVAASKRALTGAKRKLKLVSVE
ncbi:hypothetical protein GCK72_023093 [Caenorhabditis remanei]|uniref:Uncharacterized protein n=1 Tax=Caenorhabditis remanei TaxID=31234 RepID=A0A6A5FVQ6_CAERE|nr:hypothetical protein GCK72_023093 [Caenorhabditis remanei]KAF1746636.1 hypothetical protein GCK72_023093 [Caenorhabditis remanei]